MSAIARVLIVDDEEDIRKVLSAYLGKINYDVDTAENGQDAINKFYKGRYDLILSDLTMPSMDGLELLNKVREYDQDILFLMITGNPSVETAVNAIRIGAYDYIEKPILFEELKVKIERALHTKELKGQLRTSRAFSWAILVSIPIWLLLGILLAKLLK